MGRGELGVDRSFVHVRLTDLVAVVEEPVRDCIAKQRVAGERARAVGEVVFVPDPDPRARASDAALAATLARGVDVSDVRTEAHLGNALVFHTGGLATSVVDPEVVAARQVVDELIPHVVRRAFGADAEFAVTASGHFWYPPGASLGWHTNARVPGWRVYLTWVAESARSAIRFRDPATGAVHTSEDGEWDLRVFRADAEPALWHAVWSETDRFSFGYRILEPDAVVILDGVLVATRSDLRDLSGLDRSPAIEIRRMDPDDPDDVTTWLAVHNAAYGHAWTPTELQAAVLEHRHIAVTDTYFGVLDGEVVGAASIGSFRRAPHIGAGHYLGVAPHAQGSGVARALVVYRYRVLRDRGFEECESQTHIGRVRSLRLHFACGFVPKRGLDEWNNPDTWSRPVRRLTDWRLARGYRRWQATRGAGSGA